MLFYLINPLLGTGGRLGARAFMQRFGNQMVQHACMSLMDQAFSRDAMIEVTGKSVRALGVSVRSGDSLKHKSFVQRASVYLSTLVLQESCVWFLNKYKTKEGKAGSVTSPSAALKILSKELFPQRDRT